MSIKKSIGLADPTPLKENTNLKVALGYVRLLGWACFPLHSIINDNCSCGKSNCTSPGKHPASLNGLKDATKDESQIIKWWTERPYLNIGIATGQISGFFVLDIDTTIHKGSGMTGHEALSELEKRYGDLPRTPQQITGSGGLHYLFKYENGIKNRGNLFPSIDVRGDGGYIVASPSIHETGNKYEWEVNGRPSEIEVAEAPSWLVGALVTKRTDGSYKAIPTSEYVRILQGVSEGERNNSLMTLIGHLIVRLDYREAFEFVHMWNESRVNPPLGTDIVTTAFNNIPRREAEKR